MRSARLLGARLARRSSGGPGISRVAVVGLGAMGSGMAAVLAPHFETAAWDTRSDAVARAAAAGCRAAASAQDAPRRRAAPRSSRSSVLALHCPSRGRRSSVRRCKNQQERRSRGRDIRSAVRRRFETSRPARRRRGSARPSSGAPAPRRRSRGGLPRGGGFARRRRGPALATGMSRAGAPASTSS